MSSFDSTLDRTRVVPGWLAGVMTWLIGAAIFFRDPLTSGFDTITGDRGDARLVVFVHEHWWRALNGDSAWRSPDVFFPVRDTLGYSDTYALNLVFYAPLRLIGVEQFVAFQLTLIALTAVGFASLFVLFRRYLGLRASAACLLAATGVFANNVFVDTGHPQLYAVNIVSLIVLVFVAAWSASTRRRQIMCAAGGGALVGLLAWSTFYSGWFTIFLGTMGVVLLSVAVTLVRGLDEFLTVVRQRWSLAVGAIAGLLAGLIPFFVTYLPVLGDSERRTYDEVAFYAPRPLDLVNVGRHNVMWGWLLDPLMGGDARLDMLNRAVAPTPVLLVALFVATVSLLRRAARGDSGRVVVVGLGAGLVAVFAWVLPVQFGFGGVWAWAHRFVPGGSALRVYARIEVMSSLTACIAVACWLSVRRGDRPADSREAADLTGGAPSPHPVGRVARLWPLVLLSVIALEQVNTTTEFRRLDRSDELDVLTAVPEPPAGCDVFFVTDAERVVTDHTAITAMLISHEVDLPTFNGYSGQVPPGWNLQPWADDYADAVAVWLAARAPEALPCSLELTTLEWTP